MHYRHVPGVGCDRRVSRSVICRLLRIRRSCGLRASGDDSFFDKAVPSLRGQAPLNEIPCPYSLLNCIDCQLVSVFAWLGSGVARCVRAERAASHDDLRWCFRDWSDLLTVHRERNAPSLVRRSLREGGEGRNDRSTRRSARDHDLPRTRPPRSNRSDHPSWAQPVRRQSRSIMRVRPTKRGPTRSRRSLSTRSAAALLTLRKAYPGSQTLSAPVSRA